VQAEAVGERNHVFARRVFANQLGNLLGRAAALSLPYMDWLRPHATPKELRQALG
jgi:hypothetical protein